MKADSLRWRNVFAALVLASVWIVLYKAPETFGPLVRSRGILFGVLPAVFGMGLALAIAGNWFVKFWYVLGMPVIPVLIVGITFSSNTDPEGAAFIWLYAVIPALPYLIAAAATVFIQSMLSRRDHPISPSKER